MVAVRQREGGGASGCSGRRRRSYQGETGSLESRDSLKSIRSPLGREQSEDIYAAAGGGAVVYSSQPIKI